MTAPVTPTGPFIVTHRHGATSAKARDADLSDTHDCTVRASRSEAKRTTFYASCDRCDWIGNRRSTSERARRDWQEHDHSVEGVVLYREAFATLEDVRRAVECRIREWCDADGSRVSWNQAYQALRDARGVEADGTFTFPNGDVIGVEATTWDQLVFGAGVEALLRAGAAAGVVKQRSSFGWDGTYAVQLTSDPHPIRRTGVELGERALEWFGPGVLLAAWNAEHGIGIGERA